MVTLACGAVVVIAGVLAGPLLESFHVARLIPD
jgi:hypothetical protein